MPRYPATRAARLPIPSRALLLEALEALDALEDCVTILASLDTEIPGRARRELHLCRRRANAVLRRAGRRP